MSAYLVWGTRKSQKTQGEGEEGAGSSNARRLVGPCFLADVHEGYKPRREPFDRTGPAANGTQQFVDVSRCSKLKTRIPPGAWTIRLDQAPENAGPENGTRKKHHRNMSMRYFRSDDATFRCVYSRAFKSGGMQNEGVSVLVNRSRGGEPKTAEVRVLLLPDGGCRNKQPIPCERGLKGRGRGEDCSSNHSGNVAKVLALGRPVSSSWFRRLLRGAMGATVNLFCGGRHSHLDLV